MYMYIFICIFIYVCTCIYMTRRTESSSAFGEVMRGTEAPSDFGEVTEAASAFGEEIRMLGNTDIRRRSRRSLSLGRNF